MSRNYQETRERLRLILTKKKAKSNAAVSVNSEKSASDHHVVASSSCTNAVNSTQPGSANILAYSVMFELA